MNGPLKAAWALTAFAVCIGLGVLTAAGAWSTGRTEGGTRRKAAPPAPASQKEIP